ncbi:MAG: UDP-N-acetylglucosamine 2-epimerase (non-hydrolyzing) [Bdellovibrionales bacterium]
MATRSNIKALVAMGTRPECIKMAPVIHALNNHTEFDCTVLSTGQHANILDQMSDFFQLKIDYQFNAMAAKPNLLGLSQRVLLEAEKLFEKIEKPDVILVQGDTTTAFLLALVGFYNQISVAHVEAGLRTSNPKLPFPEEMNRRLISRVADFHFAPTKRAFDGLISEGIDSSSIFNSGNTIVDAQKWTLSKIEENPLCVSSEVRGLLSENGNKKVVVLTCHRRENWDNLEEIFSAINEFFHTHSNYTVIYPVHPNPVVKNAATKILGKTKNVKLIDAVDYPSMNELLVRSHFVITDSGGIQEEVIALGKPVIVLRDETERPEVIECGLGKLVGTSSDKIQEILNATAKGEWYGLNSSNSQPYGSGQAAIKIADYLFRKLGV